MSKFAVGQMVDNAADDHESGMVAAAVSNRRRQLPIRRRHGGLRFTPVLRRRKA